MLLSPHKSQNLMLNKLLSKLEIIPNTLGFSTEIQTYNCCLDKRSPTVTFNFFLNFRVILIMREIDIVKELQKGLFIGFMVRPGSNR